MTDSSEPTARTVADELAAGDTLAAHLDFELGIDPTAFTNPWAAAISSAVAFTIGALLPLVAILVPPASVRIGVAGVAVAAALAATGVISARLADPGG